MKTDETAKSGKIQLDPDTKPDQLTFEEAFSRLEKVVRRLEGEEVSLDDSLKLFEEGVSLSRICAAKLDAAEGKMRVLLEGEREAREVQFDPSTGELI